MEFVDQAFAGFKAYNTGSNFDLVIKSGIPCNDVMIIDRERFIFGDL